MEKDSRNGVKRTRDTTVFPSWCQCHWESPVTVMLITVTVIYRLYFKADETVSHAISHPHAAGKRPTTQRKSLSISREKREKFGGRVFKSHLGKRLHPSQSGNNGSFLARLFFFSPPHQMLGFFSFFFLSSSIICQRGRQTADHLDKLLLRDFCVPLPRPDADVMQSFSVRFFSIQFFFEKQL